MRNIYCVKVTGLSVLKLVTFSKKKFHKTENGFV